MQLNIKKFSDYVLDKYGVSYLVLSDDDYDNAQYEYEDYLYRLADKAQYSLATGKAVKPE